MTNVIPDKSGTICVITCIVLTIKRLRDRVSISLKIVWSVKKKTIVENEFACERRERKCKREDKSGDDEKSRSSTLEAVKSWHLLHLNCNHVHRSSGERNSFWLTRFSATRSHINGLFIHSIFIFLKYLFI